jgi:para-nitrobenzyl esterase
MARRQLTTDRPAHDDAPMQTTAHRRPILALLIAFALLASACEQFIAPPGEGVVRYRDALFSSVDVTADIIYGSAVTQQGTTIDLLIDVYEPSGDTVTQRPLVVFVHGGGFSGGTKTSAEIVDEATTLAREGYVTASISYRLTPGGCSAGGVTLECITAIGDARDDAQTAVGFMRDNAAVYGIDASRIAIAGTSAGAITAANVGFSNSDDPNTAVRAAVSLSGASILTTPDPGDAPLLLFHGTADTTVPYAWAENTVAAATANGVRAVLTTWEGAGHVPYASHRTEILEQTRNFLYWHMDLANAAA